MPTFHAQSSGTLLEEPSTRKRSYQDFLRSESHTASPSSSPPRLRPSVTPSPSDLSNMSRASPLLPRRFAGDGFDYRRPVMSTNTRQQASRSLAPLSNVIDLTNDSEIQFQQPRTRRMSGERNLPSLQHSTPRYYDVPGQRWRDVRSATNTQLPSAPVIELDRVDSGNTIAPPEPREPLMMGNEGFFALLQEPSSPGFEITGERSVRPEAPRRGAFHTQPMPYGNEEERVDPETSSLPTPLFRDLPHGLARWILQAGSQVPGRDTTGRPERNAPPAGLRVNHYTYSNGVYTSNLQHGAASGWHPPSQVQLPRIPASNDFQRPHLNYEAQGFELIGAAQSPPPRSSSPYKAPRAAAVNFVRKVGEDEIVVCPHCGDELGTGCDDLKQQIWVVKQCGHVYCGECAMNRHVGKGKKMMQPNEGKPEPFKTCVVLDCKKSVTSKTAFFQVYL